MTTTRITTLVATGLGALLIASIPAAQGTREDYERAERFLRQNIGELVHNLQVSPSWIEETDRFWFVKKYEKTHELLLVDPERATLTRAFDHGRLARALGEAAGASFEADRLPFEEIELTEDLKTVRFEVGEQRWSCDLESYVCAKIPAAPKAERHEILSPDERWLAFVREHDLWLRDRHTGREHRLTHDGEENWAWASSPDTRLTAVTERVHGLRLPPSLRWSPDSKKILTYRLDQRNVGEMHLLQSVPPPGGSRPIAHSYRHPFPGDWNLASVRYVVLDVPTASRVDVGTQSTPVVHLPALDMEWMWWNEEGTSIYWLENDRGFKTLTLQRGDPVTGEVEALMSESSKTYFEPHVFLGARPNVRVLDELGKILWFSERSGWANLYLHDLETGALANAVTTGQLIVRDVLHVDEEQGWIHFTAGREEDGWDPYYRRLFRARLDGTGMELLSPQDADHDVTASPSGKYYVDTYSRVDMAPVTVLRAADGREILELCRADITKLLATGWRYPERFTVKARDGETDLYGVLFRPTSFDPAKSYPVLDAVYPGPQVNRAPASFQWGYMDLFGQGVAMAELGFVVCTIDGLGTPLRSKAFHDFSYGKLEEAGGLEDHIAGLKQLAERYPYLDLERVGIYGGSGGGFAATRAILAHPDFYKVAVAAAGNHDQRRYIAVWGEVYQGLVDGNNYAAQVNASLAENLKGKLLLAHGDLDDNVSPTLTMQVVDALMRANKDFDLLLIPNAGHSLGEHAQYFLRRQWDYFVRHLLGVEPPKEYRIGEAMEKERKRRKAEEERDRILVDGAELEKVAGDLAFGEGPAADGAGAIYFTDIPESRILRFDPVGRTVSVVREETGRANGLMLDRDGALVICEGGNRRLTRLVDGEIEVLADAFDGKKLNSPNDLEIDARGGIYFTDPRYGDRDDMVQGFEGVYYLPPHGELIRVVDDLVRPNGLVLSLDGRTLYVADNEAKTIQAYDVAADGTLENGRLWASLDEEARGGGDGMTVDERGNVYCAGQGRIWIWTSEGDLIGQVDVPESPTNCCFGGVDGKTLYITAPSSLYRIRMKVRSG